MKDQFARPTRSFFSALLAFLFFAATAKAGPPLICHVIQIGNAKSLPWPSQNWNLSGNENYDLKALIPDTLAILDANNSALVHMETLRRATLYARKDSNVAKELIVRLHARATDAENAGHTSAMAWFDAGYAVETYKQASWLTKGGPNYATGLDGYAWVKKAISLQGNDPQMEFAAALISLSGPADEHRDQVAKATAGAKSDPLLSQNLESHFMPADSKTIADMFSNPITARKQ